MKMSPSSKHQTQNVLCFAILCRNRTVKTSHRRIVLKQKKQLASPHSAAPASHAQKSPPRKSLSGILRTFMRVADCTMPEKQAAHEWNAKLVTARWRGWVFQGDNRSKKNLTDFLFAYLWWFTTRRARIWEEKHEVVMARKLTETQPDSSPSTEEAKCLLTKLWRLTRSSFSVTSNHLPSCNFGNNQCKKQIVQERHGKMLLLSHS